MTNHEEIQRTLGRIEGGIEGIHQRLDKLNGSVANHEKRLGHAEKFKWKTMGALLTVPPVITIAIAWVINSIKN